MPSRLNMPSWRRMRKSVHDGLRAGTSQGFGPVQYREGILLTMNMLTKPSDWYYHCQSAVASTIMTVIYGKPPVNTNKDASNASIERFHDFIHGLTRAAMPGANLVEIFPWMRHIPPRFATPWPQLRMRHRRGFNIMWIALRPGRSGQNGSLSSTLQCSEAY